MLGWTFDHDIISKYIVYVGTIFNDIIVPRNDGKGNVTERVKVPLRFGPRDKMIERVQADPSLAPSRKTAISLPTMSFNLVSMQYDTGRKTNILERVVRKNPNDANKFKFTFNCVPYDFGIKLWVYGKGLMDVTKIVQQIVPFFQPEWNATIHLVPELDIIQELPLVLNSVHPDDTYSIGDFKERRMVIWEMDFTLKGALYGPVRNAPIIKFAYERFFVGEPVQPDDQKAGQILVEPGMLANGSPTTDPTKTIDPNLIFVDETWDYIIQQSGIQVKFE